MALSNNQFQEELPDELWQLTNLYYLDLAANQFHGQFSALVQQAGALQFLYLDHNKFEGALPNTLWDLTQLQELFLNNNGFTGQLPSGIEQASALTYVNVAHNELSGELPTGIKLLSALTFLDASNNQLTGVIDMRLTYSSSIWYLSLANNRLSGALPSDFGYPGLNGLYYLDLSGNQLTGNLPAALGQISNLWYLYLDHNQFSGPVPATLSNLSSLQELNLAANQLAGNLPDGGQWNSLTYARFDQNQFSGTVPDGLLSLPYLQKIWLGYNHLTGLPAPPSGTSLSALRVENNYLDFAFLEPYFTGPGTGLYPDFQYADQTLPADERILAVTTGQPWTLPSAIGGSRSHYQWQKAAVAGGAWQPLTATTAAYQRSSAVATDAARYRCQVVNDWVTGISLTSPVTTVRVQRELPPDNPSEDRNLNWTLERTYDGNGETTANIISESKQFTDGLGRVTQAQARNAATQHTFAEQTIYNSGGQAVLQTLAAPTNNRSFAYQAGFVTTGGQAYDYTSFEGSYANAPKAVDNSILGTLGYYFSKQNTLEPLTPATSYPYSLSEPYAGPLGGTKRAASPGDELRMGKGREVKGREFLVRQEFDHYLTLRPQFVPGSAATTLEYQAVKAVSVDADGRESFVVSNKEGQAIISGLSGLQYPALPVAGYLTVETPTPAVALSAPAYADIHIPAAGNQVVTFTPGSSTTSSVRVVDLLTDASYDYPVTSTSTVTPATGSYAYVLTPANTKVTLPPGFYRFVALGGTPRYAYEVHYGNLSYSYYDEAGRVVATVAPNGLAGGNLLRNAGFEQDPTGTATPSAWQKGASTTSGAAYTETQPGSPAHGGLFYGCHYQPSGTWSAYTYQVVSGLPDGYYTLRAWVENTASNAGGSISAVMQAQNYGGSLQQTALPSLYSWDPWQQISLPNIHVTNGQCEIGFSSTATGNAWIRFDDVELVRQADASAPSYVTRNTYDTSGRLLATESADEGRSEYVYAQDGRIRFSQSALQRLDGRYSYSNYDEIGRVVESGEYRLSSTGTAGVEFENHLTNQAKRLGESLLLEAEDAQFQNAINNQPYALGAASNGYEVTHLQNQGNFVKFSAPIGAELGGTYYLQIRYSNGMGSPRKMTLTVNTGTPQQLTFAPTANWDTFATYQVSIEVTGGATNTIRLEYAAGDDGYINLDYVRVTPPLLQEAEEASFSNSSGTIANASNASGGRVVNYLSSPGNLVDFELTPPSGQTGTYELQLSYSCGVSGPRTMTLSTGNTSKRLTFQSTGDWNRFAILHTTVTLQGGVANTVRLKYDAGDNGLIDLDYLRATPPITSVSRQEAEDAVFTNTNNNQPNNVSTASGGQDVGYLEAVGTGVRFSLTVPRPGTYTLGLRYASGSPGTRTLSLVVNEGAASQLSMPSTGDWSQFTTRTTTATLRAGVNTIQLLYRPGDNGSVDLDFLQADNQLAPLTHDQSVQDIVENRTWNGGLDAANCTQRNRVWYDLPFDGSADSQGNDAQLNGRQQQFVVGAVAKTQNNNVTTWYSYDELGRVTWVVQDVVGVGVKTLDYRYDFSGNVLQVAYQQDQADRFYHYYAYDAAQRLNTVHTSADGVNRTLQAEYSYYLHGPLKRVQLAGNLQGVDYTYTLQGALKNLNHVTPSLEPGHDSPRTTGVYKDLFALTLDYFSGDYASRNLEVMLPNNSNVPTRYDGTIQGAAWRTPASADVQRVVYRYDERSQLQSATHGKLNASGAYYQFTPSPVNALQEGGLTYDLNGNIQSLRRTSQTGAVTDNFSYSYQPNTNQLKEVHTGSPSGATVLSYDYDEIGQTTRQSDEQGARYFTYDVTGKTTGVYYDQAHQQPAVTFAYDDRGFRVRKTVYQRVYGPPVTTYYVRDVAGNVLASYEQVSTGPVERTEVPLYGSGRLGVLTHVADGTASGTDDYRYELTDHLGDARVVFHRPTTTTDVETMELSGVPARAAFLNANRYRVYKRRGFESSYAAGLTGTQPYGQELKRTLPVLKGDTVTFSAIGLIEDMLAARSGSPVGRVQPYLLLGAAAPASDQAATSETGQRTASAGPGKWLSRFAAGLSFTLGGHRIMQSAPSGQGARQLQAWLRYQLYDDQGSPVGNPAYAYLSSAGGWESVRLGVRVPQNGSLEVMAGTSGTDAIAYFDNLTVEQTGGLIIQEQHQYAFGAPLPGLSYTVGGVKKYHYGYQGQYAEHDNETGLESFELRMYSSRTGKWLSTDPEGQFDSSYMGMGNNPVSGTDPDGGWSFGLSALKGAAIGAAVGAVVGGGAGYLVQGNWDTKNFLAGAAFGAVVGGYLGGLDPRIQKVAPVKLLTDKVAPPHIKPLTTWRPKMLPVPAIRSLLDEGVGNFIYTRTIQTSESTIGKFYISGTKISGYVLEPHGPSTTAEGQNQRIPTGTYNMSFHSTDRFPDAMHIYNSSVPFKRYILAHNGNSAVDTEGCNLLGSTVSKNFVGNSVMTLKKVMQYYHKLSPEGFANKRYIIRESFK